MVCYCADCQAYAHALGQGAAVLDAQGGSSIVASLQQHVAFHQGADALACLALTERGIWRWYARCCNTPVANIAHRPQMSYVGLVHTVLGACAAQVAQRWPASFNVNTTHARGAVAAPGVAALLGTAWLMGGVLGARLSGGWRVSPFFRPGTAEPVAPVRVLSADELVRARAAVSAPA
jgi:hypothetical protein